MYLDDFLDKAYSTISAKHTFNEQVTSKILPLKGELSPNQAEKTVLKMQKALLNCSVAGVDSGFVSKKLSFVDVVLIRTAGVVFTYSNNSLAKADYFPSAFAFPEPILLKGGLEKDEEQQSVSLERLKQEVGTSIKIIEKYKPKYLFIDGSIVPQYQDKPRKESKINDDYASTVQLFQRLYSVAESNACTLISCVEDSRGTRFRQMLQEEILPSRPLIRPTELNDSFDASLLDYFLLPGERTFAFSYTKSVESHAILKDYSPAWAKSIYVFYIKASDFDKPLRVEFICKGAEKNPTELAKYASEVSSVVYALSSLHREYSFPSVLIEADLRARLNDQDISVVYDKLVDKLGPKVKMRRNSRPF